MKTLVKFVISDIVIIALCVIASPWYYQVSPLYKSTSKATAVINPTAGNTVRGTVSFTQEKDGVRVIANCSGLTPGNHGFHIHEFGDCSCMDAECAGSHFNPTKQPHGSRDSKHRHVGDFGNLVADEQGQAHLEFVDKDLRLNGKNSIIGRSVIVHAQEDDLVSQPSGNAGARIGCGTIGIAQQ